MNRMLRIVPISALALLAACSPSAPKGEAPSAESNVTEIAPVDSPAQVNAVEAANVAAALTDAPAIKDVAYSCTPTMAIRARYDNSDPNDAEVTLTVDGKAYDLDIAPSASGARYVTDDARAPDTTLTWWTKGPEATLYEGKEGGKPEDDKTLATCTEKP